MLKIFILLLFVISVTYSQSIEKAFFLKPDLSIGKIGFDLKEDEFILMYSKIASLLESKFSCDVNFIERKNLSKESLSSKDLYIFHILDYFLTYRGMGTRRAHLKLLILKYSSNNNYSSPSDFRLIMNKYDGSWGRNSPLEKSVDSIVTYGERYNRIGSLQKSTLNFSLDDYLENGIPFYSSDLLIMPDLSKQKMGFESDKEEIFDYSHHIAELCGKIIDDDVQLIEKSDLNKYKNVNRIFKVEFDLRKNQMSLQIYKNDLNNIHYEYSKILKLTHDWDENDEFSKKIRILFNKIARDYKKTIVNK